MARKKVITEGRTKKLLATDQENILHLEFGDEIVLPGGRTRKLFKGKGEVCARFSEALFRYLDSYNIQNHCMELVDANRLKVRRLNMLPLTMMVRNVATGDLVERFGVEEASTLDYPVLEMYLKQPQQEHVAINDSHCLAFSLATQEELRAICRIASKANAILRSFFDRRGVLLVDFRLEFGKQGNNIVIADELSPDNCRLWDRRTRKKYDFECIRSGHSNAETVYREILEKVLA